MKTIFTILSFFLLIGNAFSSAEVPVSKNANDIYLRVGNNMQISLTNLSYIKVHDFEHLTGKHLNFVDRIAFKASQKKLRKSINADGTFNNKRLEKIVSSGDHSTGFHLGGFALGFLLGIIGVLFTYVIKTDEDVDRNRKKWAWIGFGVYFVLLLALLLSVKTTA